jgi:hypothetical protein
MTRVSTLIIDFGDLPSLTAASIQPHHDKVIVWHERGRGPSAAGRLAAVEHHAEALNVERLIVSEALVLGLPELPGAPELAQSHGLLHAMIVARQLKCPKVIWPILTGPDHVRMGEVVNRAAAVAGLDEIRLVDDQKSPKAGQRGDSPVGPQTVIDLPVVDLTDAQLVEVLEDSGGPLGGFWPCERGPNKPCGRCSECNRWLRAFDEAEVAWPWTATVGV